MRTKLSNQLALLSLGFAVTCQDMVAAHNTAARRSSGMKPGDWGRRGADIFRIFCFLYSNKQQLLWQPSTFMQINPVVNRRPSERHFLCSHRVIISLLCNQPPQSVVWASVLIVLSWHLLFAQEEMALIIGLLSHSKENGSSSEKPPPKKIVLLSKLYPLNLTQLWFSVKHCRLTARRFAVWIPACPESFCEEFACSPCVCVGFLWVLRLGLD